MALSVLGPDADLFTVTPARARRSDPAESHAAAESITPHLSAERRRALNLVRLYPGRTTKELGALAAADYGGEAELWRQRIGRRLGELAEMGLIERGSVVRDGCATWHTRVR